MHAGGASPLAGGRAGSGEEGAFSLSHLGRAGARWEGGREGAGWIVVGRVGGWVGRLGGEEAAWEGVRWWGQAAHLTRARSSDAVPGRYYPCCCLPQIRPAAPSKEAAESLPPAACPASPTDRPSSLCPPRWPPCPSVSGGGGGGMSHHRSLSLALALRATSARETASP